MSPILFDIHQTTFLHQDKKFVLLTPALFADLIREETFTTDCNNAISAMYSYPLNTCGKTNIKLKGNIFLLLINIDKKLIILISQNAIFELGIGIKINNTWTSTSTQFTQEIMGLNSYQKIPDIYLIYPQSTILVQIELNHEAQQKFLVYKEEISKNIKNYRPSFFERFNNFVLGLICDYHTLRTQLLKFIAIVPALTFDNSGKTLKKSFHETAKNINSSPEKLPFYIKPLFKTAAIFTPLIPGNLFKQLTEFKISFIAKRFICTENKKGAEKIIRHLYKTGRNCTFDQLGELVICQTEAEEYCQKIVDLIDSRRLFDTGSKLNLAGIPSHHISIKTSALTPHFNEDPDAFDFVYKDIQPRLHKIFTAANQNKVFLNFDAEHYHYRDLIVKLIFHYLNQHQEFNEFHYFGFVLQAYLKDSNQHFNLLLQLASTRKHIIPIRLVKGAYWDAETIEAKAKNYDSPQFLNKVETDIQYRHLVHQILKNEKVLQLSIASHNVDDHCYAEAVRDIYYPYSPTIEHQTLHMTYEPLSMAIARFGWPMRNYLPTGSLLVGMGYLVRRIMENASQTGVLTATRHHHFNKNYISLTADLAEKIKTGQYQNDSATEIVQYPFKPNHTTHLFQKEEYSFFTKAQKVSYLNYNLDNQLAIPVYSKFGSQNILGKILFQTSEDANAAVEKANLAKSNWANSSPQYRAHTLQTAAQLLRLEKFAISKLIMEEAGKTRMEAFGDVEEAIDFLNFYAAETLKDKSSNSEPYGIFAIISPWNFPLAILCGMTAAALATGNIVIMKPAEQSPFTALAFFHILLKANIPDGVIQILIGNGETVGAALVKNPHINGIAFTGSKQVGLYIYRNSLRMIAEKKLLQRSVITEMGGKNALIICKDAELDQAISSCIYSAFAHAGQKCSACSRILVHQSIIDQFTKRFSARASEIAVTTPEFAEAFINPLISKEEKDKSLKNAQNMVDISKKYGEKILLDKVKQNTENLVGPLIIQLNAESLKDPEHPVYREMFAPLIYVIPFDTDDQAISIFNNSVYALTGGVFTQSDQSIDYFQKNLKAGNLYFNRNITGARVAIEPFGGFYLSGTGPKAGGANYLNAFRKKIQSKPFDENQLSPIKFIRKSFQIKFEKEFLFPIPGQTTYLDYQIKKEEVLFIIHGNNCHISIFDLINLCLDFQIKIRILCLSENALSFFKASSLETFVELINKNEISNHHFSTNLDLIVFNSEDEINSIIFQVFSDEKYYQKKMLKFTNFSVSEIPGSIQDLAKTLCEPRTMAINTMRYGAPLEE